MKRKINTCIIIVVLLTAWYSPPALASDYPAYIYIAEHVEEPWQNPNTLGIDNYVQAMWLYWGTVEWWADASLVADTQAAINDWYAVIDKLPYYKIDTPNGHLRVNYAPCPGDAGAASCYKVAYAYNIYLLPQKASYVMQSDIYINPDVTIQWPGSSRKAAIAHELGQLYGLNERKLTNNSCNPDELTIMDMLQKVWVGDHWEVSHCDGIEGPTVLDKWRVDAFWSGGAPLHGDLPISAWGNGPVATYKWKDLAWAERFHYLDFQYLNTSGQWITFVSTTFYQESIGTHMYTQDRDMAIAIDLTAPEFENIPGGWHRACAWAGFTPYGVYGNGQCSMPVELTDPG